VKDRGSPENHPALTARVVDWYRDNASFG